MTAKTSARVSASRQVMNFCPETVGHVMVVFLFEESSFFIKEKGFKGYERLLDRHDFL